MRVAVLANDVVPGMGVPVAAPGLRAWGIAEGLRAHGVDTTLVVDERVVSGLARDVPLARAPGSLVVHPRDVPTLARTRHLDAVVVTNSNPVPFLDGLDCAMVYDFFAPKVLELDEETRALDEAAAGRRREKLVARKLDGLRRSAGVIVNGAKKDQYVEAWLERAGVPDLPRRVVNMALPLLDELPEREPGPVRAVVSGYVQPWSAPGAWVESITEHLERGDVELHLLIGRHWGDRNPGADLGGTYQRLAEHPGVVRHGSMTFGDFRRLLVSCDLSIDVFARNPERELAMVTRSIVALSCGLPVLHVPFTEVGPMIEAYGAGWVVDPDDPVAARDVIDGVVAEPGALDACRRGAQALAADLVDPARATAPLVELLGEIGVA